MATSSSNRRQPTRSARTTTTRPTNYYAKPFSYRSSAASLVDNDPPVTTAPGFFPAITFFTDSIAALPREVQRHYTTLKETEGKAHQPDTAIAELVAAINKLPPAPHPQYQDRSLPYMQFSLANSVNGSVNGEAVDGNASKSGPARPASELDMVDAPSQQVTDEYAEQRHDLFAKLQVQVGEMAKILEEKNMVLSTMNETLGRQLKRLESAFPYIEDEISEDARLGSNTHWALPHMKELRRVNGASADRRRDVTTVNNLAAAAAAVHETEIAATRSEARREAMLAKRSRGPAPDFNYDDRAAARKQSASGKVRKTADAAPTVNGSSANKRRRTEKPGAVSAERAMSAALHGRLAQPGRSGSRDTSTADAARKKPRPAPVQTVSRKMYVASDRLRGAMADTSHSKPGNSPSLVSSPSRGTFSTATTGRAQSPARVSNSRARQPSVSSLTQDSARKGQNPTLSGRKQEDAQANTTNGGAVNDRSAPMEVDANPSTVGSEAKRPASAVQSDADATVKRETAALASATDFGPVTAPSHSRTNSKSAMGGILPPKPTTPHNIFAEVAPLMSRSRSGRGVNGPGGAASPGSNPNSGAASPSKRSHKRGGGSTANAKDAAAAIAAAMPAASSDDDKADRLERIRRPRKHGGPEGDALPTSTPAGATPELGPEPAVEADDGDIDMDADLADMDRDDIEPLYCFCQQPSEGEMIACDNEACPTEWFHLDCVALARAPKNNWFCSEGCKRQALRGKR